jgi:hypothetical protein
MGLQQQLWPLLQQGQRMNIGERPTAVTAAGRSGQDTAAVSAPSKGVRLSTARPVILLHDPLLVWLDAAGDMFAIKATHACNKAQVVCSLPVSMF